MAAVAATIPLVGLPIQIEPSVTVFEVRDAVLGPGRTLGIGLHPSATPIEVRSSEADLQVCPAGWPSFAEFRECLPLNENGRLTLPSTVSPTFHLGIRIKTRAGRRVEVDRLRITYEPEDGYFVFEPPRVAARGKTPTLVVTPMTRDSIGLGPFYERGPDAENRTVTMRPIVRQGGERVGHGGEPPRGRTEQTFGPVDLDEPVRIQARNPSRDAQDVAMLVDWE